MAPRFTPAAATTSRAVVRAKPRSRRHCTAPRSSASRAGSLRTGGFIVVQLYGTSVPIAGRWRMPLLGLNIAVLVSLALHDVDHLRQAADADYDIPLRLFATNALAYVPTLAATYLSWR